MVKSKAPIEIMPIIGSNRVTFDEVEFVLPERIFELDLEELSSIIIDTNERYTQDQKYYLSILHYDKLDSGGTPLPWITALQSQLLAKFYEKVDWISSKNRPTNLILFQALNIKGIQLFDFPVQLFISNHVDLAIHYHYSAFQEHYYNNSNYTLVLDYLDQRVQFEYELQRSWLNSKLCLTSYQAYLKNVKH